MQTGMLAYTDVCNACQHEGVSPTPSKVFFYNIENSSRVRMVLLFLWAFGLDSEIFNTSYFNDFFINPINYEFVPKGLNVLELIPAIFFSVNLCAA